MCVSQVNQAVDSMAEERVRLQAEIDEAKLEAETAKSGGQQLHQEHSRLLQRIGTLEDQQVVWFDKWWQFRLKLAVWQPL